MIFTITRIVAFFGVSLVILFCYLPVILFFDIEYYFNHSVFVIISIIYLTAGVILIFWSYFVAVFSNPGYQLSISH